MNLSLPPPVTRALMVSTPPGEGGALHGGNGNPGQVRDACLMDGLAFRLPARKTSTRFLPAYNKELPKP